MRWEWLFAPGLSGACQLEAGDTADWKSALRAENERGKCVQIGHKAGLIFLRNLKIVPLMRDRNALEDFLGEEVVDKEGNPVGTFACYWEREQKQALLLGVDIPERSGHTHLVPAKGASFNERQTYVRVPFTRDQIMHAPSLACECEVDDDFERRLWAYYGLPVPHAPGPDLLSQKIEVIRQQLRRINHCDTAAARRASRPSSFAGSAAGEPAVGNSAEASSQETTPVLNPADPAPSGSCASEKSEPQ
ncbi:MAG: hypothetical protein QOF48_1550 [Verrucomicrobiota bacterium]